MDDRARTPLCGISPPLIIPGWRCWLCAIVTQNLRGVKENNPFAILISLLLRIHAGSRMRPEEDQLWLLLCYCTTVATHSTDCTVWGPVRYGRWDSPTILREWSTCTRALALCPTSRRYLFLLCSYVISLSACTTRLVTCRTKRTTRKNPLLEHHHPSCYICLMVQSDQICPKNYRKCVANTG